MRALSVLIDYEIPSILLPIFPYFFLILIVNLIFSYQDWRERIGISNESRGTGYLVLPARESSRIAS